MVKVRIRKSPELIEAQIGDFASSEEENKKTRRIVERGKHITDVMGLVDPHAVTSANRVQDKVSDNPLKLAVGKADYAAHLRMRYATPEGRSLVEAKAAAIKLYEEKFKQAVDQAVYGDTTAPFSEGSYATAYRFNVDGVEYVARKIVDMFDVVEVDKHISASLLVKDIPHMEQVQAVSYRDRVTVAPVVPGENFRYLATNGDISSVTEAQIESLYSAMTQAEVRGVRFDFRGGNLLYDSEAGFTVIDMAVAGDYTHSDIHHGTNKAMTTMMGILSMNLPSDLEKLHQIDRVATILERLVT